MSLEIGSLFDNKYALLEKLGSGGLGVVYKALQLDCKRLVALKIIKDGTFEDADTLARFQREAIAMSKLSHPNVVLIYHIGFEGNAIPYIAMELIEGKTLRSLIREGKISPLRALKIIHSAAKALAHVHSHGIVHRDLKPENIVICDLPEADTVKVIDFGLASANGAQLLKLTQSGALIGTAEYMSPEQAAGKNASPASDIYSLTVCLFEMLTGDKLFDADNALGILYKHQNEPIPDSPAFRQYPCISSIIKEGLAKKPEQRFSSMDEFADQVQACMTSLASGEAHSVRTQKANILIPTGFALCLLLLAFASFFLNSPTPRNKLSGILKLPNDQASEKFLALIKAAKNADTQAAGYVEQLKKSDEFNRWKLDDKERLLFHCFLVWNSADVLQKQILAIDTIDLLASLAQRNKIERNEPPSAEEREHLRRICLFLLEHPCQDMKQLMRLNRILLAKNMGEENNSRVIYYLFVRDSIAGAQLFRLGGETLIRCQTRSVSDYKLIASRLLFDAAITYSRCGDNEQMLILTNKAKALLPDDPDAIFRYHLHNAIYYQHRDDERFKSELAMASTSRMRAASRHEGLDSYYQLLVDNAVQTNDWQPLHEFALQCKREAEEDGSDGFREKQLLEHYVRAMTVYLEKSKKWDDLGGFIHSTANSNDAAAYLLFAIAEGLAENPCSESVLYLRQILALSDQSDLQMDTLGIHVFLHRLCWILKMEKEEAAERRLIINMVKDGKTSIFLDRFYVDAMQSAHQRGDLKQLYELATAARKIENKSPVDWVRKETAYQLGYYYLKHDNNKSAATEELQTLKMVAGANESKIAELEKLIKNEK